ncbi:hypothetical protein KCP73_18075 [Salmonella enterica subsp. enterica]|nr:hypothetical protein KCP73_18075 [Salmonella enterica subsp. enterica]
MNLLLAFSHWEKRIQERNRYRAWPGCKTPAAAYTRPPRYRAEVLNSASVRS